MTKIHELFDEAVSGAPPSRLTAEDIFGAARTRRRRATARLAGLVVALASLAGVAAVTLAGGDAANPPAGAAPPGVVVWAGRADASHLYVLKNICGINPRVTPPAAENPAPNVTPEGTATVVRPTDQPVRVCNELFASADGGTTWISRGPMAADSLTIVGPQSVIRYVGGGLVTPSAGSASESIFQLSNDGGATWITMPKDGPPIEALPAGGTVLENDGPSGVSVFDPAQGRIRPLIHQPDLLDSFGVVTSGSAAMWAPGFDRSSGRPAIAVSHDGGASWTQQMMPNTKPGIDPVPGAQAEGSTGFVVTSALTGVISRDGNTAYATMFDGDVAVNTPSPAAPGTEGWGVLRAFRTTDGGATWQDVDAGATIPTYSGAWLTADDRLVLSLTDRQLGGWPTGSPTGAPGTPINEFLVSPDGRSFELGTPPGLPAALVHVDGAIAYTDHGVYTSDDGWTWHEAWHD